MPAPRGHRAVVALQAGCVVLVLLAAALPLEPVPRLFGYPINEDGYYALTAARQLGLGHGLSVDGVHATGGVQPLWVFLLAPISWLWNGDRTALVRGALAISVLLYVAAGMLIGVFAARLARAAALPERASGWLAALVYMSCGTSFESHFNLLETGLVLALYVVVLLTAARVDWRRRGSALIVGALCGVLVLARVDAVFFVALLTPIVVRPRDAGGLRGWVARAVLVPAVAAIVSSPWFAYNVLSFGHMTPSGGLAQASSRLSPGNVIVAAMYFAGRLVPLSIDIIYPGRYETASAALIAAGLLMLLIRPALRRRVLALLDHRDGRGLVLLVASGAVLAVWYGVSSRAWWMFMRYMAPCMIAGASALALIVASWVRDRASIAAALSVALVGGLAAARYLPSTGYLRERSHIFFVAVADEVVPAGSRVGAFQSGTLGFFRDGVVNLDGKVNEGALAARGRLMEYCDAEAIEWVADWPQVLRGDFFHGPPAPGWALVAERRLPGCASCDFQVFRRK